MAAAARHVQLRRRVGDGGRRASATASALVCGAAAPHLRRARGPRQPAGQPPAGARASSPATTSASTSRTAPSTSRRCWPASRSGPSRSTSTTGTSPASCATCSTTATPSACCTAPQHAEVVAERPARPAAGARGRSPPATTYDAALAAASPSARRAATGRGDDHYVIYTGGTTGLPKGVVWRQEDAFFACLGGGDPMRIQGEVTVARRAARAHRRRHHATCRSRR